MRFDRRFLFIIVCLMALAAVVARAFDYTLIGPPGGSFKSVEYLKDGTLLAGSFSGHLYLSVDYGHSWTDVSPQPLIRGMFVQKISYHRLTDTVYIAARSLRQGTLFRVSYHDAVNGMVGFDPLFETAPIRSFVLSDNASPRIFVGTEAGLQYSLDGGENWNDAESRMPNREVQSVTVDPDNEDKIYAGSRQRAYYTINFGKTWTPVHSGMAPDSDLFTIGFDAKNRLWAGTCGYAYVTTDKGEMWVKKETGLKGKRIHSLEFFDKDSGGDIYAGSENGLHLFKETADAWLPLIPDIVVQDITRDEFSRLYIATEGLGIIRFSIDPPEKIHLNNGLDASSPNAITGSLMTTLWTGLVYQNTYTGLWQYYQEQWKKVEVECDGANVRALVANDTCVYAATSNGIFRLERDPLTGLETGQATRFMEGRALKTLYLEDDGTTILTAGFQGIYILNTQDGEYAAYPGMKDVNINCLWKCRTTGRIFAGSDLRLYRKEAASINWIPVELPFPGVRINRIAGTKDGKQIYLATGKGIMVSYNSGERFSRFTGDGPAGTCLDVVVRGEYVYALMNDHRVFYRKTDNFAWQLMADLPFDAWSLYAPKDSDSLLIGTPANGIVVLSSAPEPLEIQNYHKH
jgi:photosystem II stability/assembly factor-like uncharacterized protein